jgi:hypothetical protein
MRERQGYRPGHLTRDNPRATRFRRRNAPTGGRCKGSARQSRRLRSSERRAATIGGRAVAAEPHHATSVSGRAAEPKNSVGGAFVGNSRRPRPNLAKGCGMAMESLAGAVLLADPGCCPIAIGRRQYSSTYRKTSQVDPANISPAFLWSSRCTRNFQSRSSFAFAAKNWLKSGRSAHSFILCRDDPGKPLGFPCLTARTFTRSHVPPMGLSGAIRHTDPSL